MEKWEVLAYFILQKRRGQQKTSLVGKPLTADKKCVWNSLFQLVMGKMRQKDYPSTSDIRHVSSSLVFLSVLRTSWWLNHNFFHETSKEAFCFSISSRYIYLPSGTSWILKFIPSHSFSSDWGKPDTLNYAVLFKACHHSFQDIRCGEGWCYSFTIHFISFDFVKKKYTKIWKGKNKSFNNNHLQLKQESPLIHFSFIPSASI